MSKRSTWIRLIAIAFTTPMIALACAANQKAQKEDKGEKALKVKFADAPAAVQKTMTEQAKGAKIDSLDKEVEKGQTVYEADVMLDGKEYEIVVAEDGKLVSKDLAQQEGTPIKFSEAPAAVQKTFKDLDGGQAIDKLDKEDEDGKTIYEGDIKIGGKNYEVKVAPDGKLISKTLDEEGDEKDEKNEKNEKK